jgi:hypothetical protein
MIPGIHKATDSEVASAVQAITQRITNTKQIFMTPIWPITMLAGNRDLEFAAFIMLGPKKEEPMPANVKDIERMTRARALLSAPITFTKPIPIRKEPPETKDATLLSCCMG